MNVKIIADPHGQTDKLTKGLKKLKKDKYDKLIFLGDYFDRAPAPLQKKMIRYVVKHYSDKDKIFLKGNHDLWLQKHLNKELHLTDYQIWAQHCNGGGETWDAVKEMEKKEMKTLNKLKDILNDMKYYYVINNHIFTHAGLDWTLDKIVVEDKDIWGDTFYKNIVAEQDNDKEKLDKSFNSRSSFFKNKIFVLGHYVIPLHFKQALVSFPLMDEVDKEGNMKWLNYIQEEYVPYNIRNTIYLNDIGLNIKELDLFIGEYKC